MVAPYECTSHKKMVEYKVSYISGHRQELYRTNDVYVFEAILDDTDDIATFNTLPEKPTGSKLTEFIVQKRKCQPFSSTATVTYTVFGRWE